jgi:CRP/FNR family cyclic AMP-dependent transcriptional regulator
MIVSGYNHCAYHKEKMMEKEYLKDRLPFWKNLNKKKQDELEHYFHSAPAWLVSSLQPYMVDKNVVFVHENDRIEYIYVLVTGTIKATDYRILGISFDFMKLQGIYAMGGMEVIMDLGHYRATLVTVSPCSMIRIPRIQFERWLKEDIIALKREAKAACEYLVDEARQSRAFLFLEGADRLCMLFLSMYQKGALEDKVEIRLTRNELSEQLGISIKTVNRAIKKFQEEGLISRNGNGIVISTSQYEKLKEKVKDVVEL